MSARLLARNYLGSASFPSATSVAASASSAALSPGAGSFTVAWWQNYAPGPGTPTAIVLVYGASPTTTGWEAYGFGSTMNVVIKSGSTAVGIASAFTPGWNRFALSFDASTHTVYAYKNGVLVAQSAGGAWSGSLSANDVFNIGVSSLYGACGLVDDVIYDVAQAWTAAQVLADYISNSQPTSANQHRWKLDDGAGTSAADTGTTATPLALTLSGGAAFSPQSPMRKRPLARQYGGSLSLTAYSGQYARSASSAAISPGAGSFTIAWWGQFSGYSAGNFSIAQFAAVYTTGWLITQNGAGNCLLIYLAGALKIASSDAVFSDLGWHRWAVVCDASGPAVRVYRDGALVVNKSVAGWGSLAANDVLNIGQGNDAIAGCSKGLVDDFVYDLSNAWTAAQVLADYENNIQPVSANQHRWKLDEGSGTSAADTGTTATPLALTLSGGAVFSAQSPMKLRTLPATKRPLARMLGGSVDLGARNGGRYMSAGANAAFSPGSGSFVLAFNANLPPAPTAGTNVLFSYAPSTYNTDGLLVSWYSNQTGLTVYTKSGTECGLRLLVVAGWHRYVLVFDASVRLVYGYRDGVLISTSSGNWAAGTFRAVGDLLVGDNPTASSGGLINDLIWDVSGNAWSAAQVLAEYQTGVVPSGSNQHRWPLDEGYGTSARDTGSTATPLALTLAGGAVFSAQSPMKLRGAVQNYWPNSNDVTQASWTKLNTPAALVAMSNPAGVANASRITESNDGAPTAHSVYLTALPAGVPVPIGSGAAPGQGNDWILSGYFKPEVRSWIELFCDNSTGSGCYFDATNGVIGTAAGGVVGQIVAAAGYPGWYRAWIRFNMQAGIIGIETANANGGVSYQGNGSVCFDFVGMMLEKCAPGQTTPSDLVTTGAAPLSAYGVKPNATA